ncbi:hypothetical protein [Compostibacter hankyongensis]|uniref:Acid shock protein n=1 Tax=Compostibacter hankyongensis TaxID=1007089 RepID=A0ABP8FL01_9BACT
MFMMKKIMLLVAFTAFVGATAFAQTGTQQAKKAKATTTQVAKKHHAKTHHKNAQKTAKKASKSDAAGSGK